jgi:hypothetical protein
VTRVRTELQRLEFGRMLCGEDWHDIEDWGVWARGPVARLAFGLADRETTTVCYLRLVLPRWLGRQRGEIVVDGRIADEPYLDDTPRTLSFRIEPRADGRHQVEIRLPGFAPPPADDPESRIIGVGLVHLHLCGENDVAARLQYIERSLPADPRA